MTTEVAGLPVPPLPGRPAPRRRRVRQRLARVDRHLLVAAARRRSPAADRLMMAASESANRSMLWLGVSAVLTATGRRAPRSAAASGLLGIGIAATLVNGPLKFAWRRDRPPTAFGSGEPLLPLPRTFSFPSGHSASALAFATGATVAFPAAGAVLLPAAGTVAYSRVHTGVHYPSDVVVGATVGALSGLIGAKVVQRMRDRSVHRVEGPALAVKIPRQAVLLTADGSGSAADLAPARAALEEAGFTIEDVVPVEDVRRLRERLQEADEPPLVIAAGGDGTVCAAVNAVHGTEALLAIVPLGTSNDVARSLGIPPDGREAACMIAENARVCAVDAGRMRLGDGERIFLNAATSGLNVAFAQQASDGSLRDRFGGLTYPVAAARALRGYEPFECTVEHDGRRRALPVVHLSVSNAPVFGGLLGMRVPGASMTDGRLDVIIAEPLTTARLALAVADTVIGRHRPVHRVHAMRVESLRVSSSTRQEIALDGEVIGELPAEFEVLPGAVRVVVPPLDGSD